MRDGGPIVFYGTVFVLFGIVGSVVWVLYQIARVHGIFVAFGACIVAGVLLMLLGRAYTVAMRKRATRLREERRG